VITICSGHGSTLWTELFHNDNLTYAVNNWVGAVLVSITFPLTARCGF